MDLPHPMNATTQADQDHPPPPLWRHGLAMLYDTLLVVPLFMAAAGLWVGWYESLLLLLFLMLSLIHI